MKESFAEFKVYCPSYRRSKTAISHKLFYPEHFVYVVNEDEAEEYSRLGYPILPVPIGATKNIVTTRNWILDNKISKYVLMVDDDIKKVFRCENRKLIEQSRDQILEDVVLGFRMAEEAGSGIWGFNVQYDPKMYRTHTPFSFSLVIYGTWLGILDTSLRFDERLTLKEDADFFLQQIHKHRIALRFNYLSYLCDHQRLAGGCQEYRTTEMEREQAELFQRKWGEEIVRKNTISKGSINMILKTGLGL